MGPRENAIREYIEFKHKELNKHNIYLEKEKIDKAVEKYSSMEGNMGDIQKQIDKDVDELIEQTKIQIELKEAYLNKINANKDLENEDIPLEYINADVDKEMADIMNIKDVSNIDDLKYEIKESEELDPSLENQVLTDKQVLDAQNETYKLFQDTKEDENEYQKDSSSMIQKKTEILKDNKEITEEDKDKIDEVMKTSTTTDEMVDKIGTNFNESEAHDMYEIINQDTPLNESSIEKTINDPEINPFYDENDHSELNEMFKEEVEKEQELTNSSDEKSKPKVFVKTDNASNNEGSIGIMTIATIISILIITIIGFITAYSLIK